MASVHVGGIDATIRANETMRCFRDSDAVSALNDALAFVERGLRNAGIKFEFFGPLLRVARWSDGFKRNDQAFRLGNDLVGDDEHVASFELLALGRREYEGGDVIARADFADAFDGNGAEFRHARRPCTSSREEVAGR